MRGVVLSILLVVTSGAQAIDVIHEPTEPAHLTNFSENLYGKDLKTCFVGSVTDVCSEVKETIRRANYDLSRAGASQRFKVEACAQNPGKAMVIYSQTASRKVAATSNTTKTVYIEPCGGDQIRRITVTFTE